MAGAFWIDGRRRFMAIAMAGLAAGCGGGGSSGGEAAPAAADAPASAGAAASAAGSSGSAPVVADSSAAASAKLSPLAALGEQIFHDATLSEPAGQSCASCHRSDRAHATDDVVQTGVVATRHGTRNSP